MADLILGNARLTQSCEPKKDHSGCDIETMQNREGQITLDKQSDPDPSVVNEAGSNIEEQKTDTEVNGKADGENSCLANREDSDGLFGIESRESRNKETFSNECEERSEPQCSDKDVLAFSKDVCRDFGAVLESDGGERNHEEKDNTDILSNDKEADSGCDVLDPDRVDKLDSDSIPKDCSKVHSSDTCSQEKDKLSSEDGGDSSFAENVTKEIDDDRGERRIDDDRGASCTTGSHFNFKGDLEKKDISHSCNTFEVEKMRVEFPGSAELDESFKNGLPLGTREEAVDLDTVLNLENQTLNGVCVENEISEGVVIDGEEAESVLHNFVPHYDPDTETQLTDLSVSGAFTDGEGGGGEESSCNELGPHAKRRKLMELDAEEEKEKEENEDSPVVGLQLAPVANGHGMWGSSNLRTLLQEKGSVTLQLFGSVTDYGIYTGKIDGDLLAVVVDVHNEPEPEEQVDLEQGDSPFDSLDTSYNQTLNFTSLSRKSRGRGGSRGRMSTRPLSTWHPYLAPNTQLMSGYNSFENFFSGPEWQGKGFLSGHLRKIPFQSSQQLLPRRGPGRPPKTQRQAFSPPPYGIPGYYSRPEDTFGRVGGKSKFSISGRSRSFLKSPERTQSPPQFKFLEAMRKSGISFLDTRKSHTGSDNKRTASDISKESHVGPPPTPPTKLPIISKTGSKGGEMEKTSPSTELTNGDIRSPSKVVKNPLIKIKCEYCDTVFRKKAALNAHVKHKHRKMRECPICKEKIKIKGKYGMKFHILKMHKDMSRHQCDECDEAFKLRHHLINHKRMVHELGISDEETEDEDAEDEEEEEDEESEDTEIEEEKIEKEKKTETDTKVETDEEEEGPVFRRTTRSNMKPTVVSEAEEKEDKEKEDKEEQESVARSEQKSVLKNEPKSVPKSEPKTTQKDDKIEPKGNKKGKTSPVPSSTSSSEGSSSDSEVEEPKKYFCDMCDLGFSHLFKMKHHKKEAHRKIPQKPVLTSAKIAKLKLRPSKEDLTCSYCDRICRSMYQLGLHIDKHQRKGDMEREVGPKTLTARQIRMLEAKKIAEEKQREREAAAAEEDDESQSEEESEEEARPPGRPPNRRQIEKSLKADEKVELSKSGGPKSSGSKQKVPKKKNNAKAPLPPPPPSEGKEDEEEEEEGTQDDNSKEVEDMSAYIINDGVNFECTKCEISFKREKYLTYHMKKIHETMYPFRACEFCGKIFRSSGPYNRHVTQHKVYNCPIENCKAKYRNMRRMKQHQKNSHGDVPHRCPRCVELFVLEEQLEKHIKEKHPKNPSDDDDDDDEDGEDNEKDEEENDNNGGNSEKEEDKEKKASKDKKASKQDDDSVPKDKKEERTRIRRRTRCIPISYKESDDDDELIEYRKVKPRELKNSSPENLEVQTPSLDNPNPSAEAKERIRTSPRKTAIKDVKEYVEESEDEIDAEVVSVTEEKNVEKRVPDPHADSGGEENLDLQDKDEKSSGGKKGKDNGLSQEEEGKKTPSKNNKKSKNTNSKKSGGSTSPPKRQRKRRLRQSTRINSYQGGGVFYYSQDSQGFGDGYFMDTDSMFDFDDGSRVGKCPPSEEISDFMAEDGQVLTFDSF
ncbi:uncharacterized protein LOC143020685 [Oratosquilla oratoria]|uniref:uncharacterized protein LOC143020685 n=1 Tax=Oratosquilla oratoria TaxID=337810 RepID=UPI003F776810